MPAATRGLRRPGIRLLAGAAALLASAAFLGAGALYALGAWFQFSEPPRPADCIVVLGGDPSRSLKAAELYRDSFAPEVWVSRPVRNPWQIQLDRIGMFTPPEEEFHLKALVEHGVPKAAIRFFGKNNLSTAQEAVELSKILPAERRRVLLVSSRTHLRRARMIFRRGLPDREFIAVSSTPDPPQPRWWRDKSLAQEIAGETLRTVYYLIGGRFMTPRG